MLPTTRPTVATAPIATRTRFRRMNFDARYLSESGRALTGSWRRYRCRSSANAAAVGESRDQGAQCFRSPARTADHATEVLGVHAHLEDIAAWGILCYNVNLVGVIDDPLNEVLESGCEHS